MNDFQVGKHFSGNDEVVAAVAQNGVPTEFHTESYNLPKQNHASPSIGAHSGVDGPSNLVNVSGAKENVGRCARFYTWLSSVFCRGLVPKEEPSFCVNSGKALNLAAEKVIAKDSSPVYVRVLKDRAYEFDKEQPLNVAAHKEVLADLLADPNVGAKEILDARDNLKSAISDMGVGTLREHINVFIVKRGCMSVKQKATQEAFNRALGSWNKHVQTKYDAKGLSAQEEDNSGGNCKCLRLETKVLQVNKARSLLSDTLKRAYANKIDSSLYLSSRKDNLKDAFDDVLGNALHKTSLISSKTLKVVDPGRAAASKMKNQIQNIKNDKGLKKLRAIEKAHGKVLYDKLVSSELSLREALNISADTNKYGEYEVWMPRLNGLETKSRAFSCESRQGTVFTDKDRAIAEKISTYVDDFREHNAYERMGTSSFSGTQANKEFRACETRTEELQAQETFLATQASFGLGEGQQGTRRDSVEIRKMVENPPFFDGGEHDSSDYNKSLNIIENDQQGKEKRLKAVVNQDPQVAKKTKQGISDTYREIAMKKLTPEANGYASRRLVAAASDEHAGMKVAMLHDSGEKGFLRAEGLTKLDAWYASALENSTIGDVLFCEKTGDPLNEAARRKRAAEEAPLSYTQVQSLADNEKKTGRVKDGDRYQELVRKNDAAVRAYGDPLTNEEEQEMYSLFQASVVGGEDRGLVFAQQTTVSGPAAAVATGGDTNEEGEDVD